ncbi:Endopolyphosphatase Ppn1p-related protein [Penicillium malachiteum]|uniref:Endopolyphosphatase n=1 Tax=Penicillium malachiteum TaxID=1324776 RepID=A0AAD6MV70_9EURO|nr:Endopolyphosphatase Ppn1p-related protein [Penicillium malachiteum]
MQSILLLSLFAGAIQAAPLDQQPLKDPHVVTAEFHDADAQLGASTPGLHGRFLHITDFHPDRYYKYGGSTDDESCHHGKGDAAYFGKEGTECDSPISLVNETFRWLEQNLRDDIDFVIWTGDSARHDNDERIPRTEDEIQELNQFMAGKWVELFGTRKNDERVNGVPQVSVPVVPTFGNNDIAPHNIFMNGPNIWTKKYVDIWHHFIPEDQRHSFVEGGWFTSEVIPGRLAVISLNTMYFFDSNSAVDGCAAKSEPGFEHMEWLRVQLEILRTRNMKAILMGHVPPARSDEKKNWDETCWQKYTLWVNRYRDVVVGSVYGHMNVDHFMLQDTHDVDFEFLVEKTTSERVGILSKADYINSLRDQWADLPSPPSGVFDDLEESSVDATKKKKKKKKDSKKKKDDEEEDKKKKKKKQEQKRKKFLKKIDGPWAERYSVSLVAPSLVPNYFPTLRVIEYNITGLENAFVDEVPMDAKPSPISDDQDPPLEPLKKKKKEKKKPDFKVPDAPSPTSVPGPAYSNQALTWLSYTQYFANLTKLNEEFESGSKDAHIEFEVEYSTNDDVYRMNDLTVRSFFQLAVRIGEGGEAAATKVNEAWRAFLTRAFTGFFDANDLNDDVESV